MLFEIRRERKTERAASISICSSFAVVQLEIPHRRLSFSLSLSLCLFIDKTDMRGNLWLPPKNVTLWSTAVSQEVD